LSLVVVVAGLILTPGCGEETTNSDTAPSGGGNAGSGGGNAGSGGGNAAGSGGGNAGGGSSGGQHFMPPSALTDRFADDVQLEGTLDNTTENDCEPGLFRISGSANDVGISHASGVMAAAFSNGPGVETFDAQAGELTVALSYDAAAPDGATTLSSGMMTTVAGVDFCFDGGVRPRADFEGNTYVVLAAATLYEVANGSCTTTLLGGFDNHVYACIATEPSP
jgi:hypothetical protein